MTHMHLVQRIKSDIDLLLLHQLHADTYPYLLETAVTSTAQHFDILFAFPRQTLVLRQDSLIFESEKTLADDTLRAGNDFINNLDQWWHKEKNPSHGPDSLPFTGGWFVFLSYELAGQIEPTLHLPRNAHCEPVAFATRIPAALIKDHNTGDLYAVAEDGEQPLIDAMVSHVQSAQNAQPENFPAGLPDATVTEENPAIYLAGVDKIKHYIKNGDVFQVNLSRWWNIQFTRKPSSAQLYRQLRIHNPSPFFGLAKYGDSVIISSSPERLVKVRHHSISTRPIAGTRPRSGQSHHDLELRNELMAHPKERAEHIMLIDLERNDLGRICTPGSIKVDELMALESYSHVHHIVSNITGQLRDEVTPGQVLRAMFPGGTITGCPKVRCMEIIAELEASGRGAYTGSMGYINLNGDMDFNILIRTMVQCENNVRLRAGAGIVADSIAEKELAETRAKAKGLLNSLGLAGHL